jgi:hypothetical protein
MEDGDEVVPSDVTSEVTGGDVTSEGTDSDVSSRGTGVNSDFEVCSSPQQGREITSDIFLKRILYVSKRITFFLPSLLPQVGMLWLRGTLMLVKLFSGT